MTNSKNTKRALLASVMSVMLCVAMLVGTTFAWFTDSVTSGNNKIVAGNLDVELYHGENLDTKVDEKTELFTDINGAAINWEPGVVIYENFKVANEGNLALMYKLALNIVGYNKVADTEKSLMDVLKIAVVEDGFTGGRVDIAGLAFESIADFAKKNTMTGELSDSESDTFGFVIYWEPGENDNDYNLKNGAVSNDGEPLYIDLGISLNATQYTEEYDSFDNQYDKDAAFELVEPWDGTTKTEPEQDENGTYQIRTADEMAWVRDNLAGNKFELQGDINFGGQTLSVSSNAGNFTFNGNGHKIANFSMDAANSQAGTGLFGSKGIRNATISNVNIDNVTAEGNEYTGILMGMSYACTFENITISNADVKGFKWVGAIGYAAENTNMKNITVTDSTFALDKGSALDRSKVGAVAGAWQTTAGGGAAAEDINVDNITVSGGLKGKGLIIGTYDGRAVATMTNCHATNSTGSNYLVGEIYKGNGYPEGATLQAKNCDDNVQSSYNNNWEVIE